MELYAEILTNLLAKEELTVAFPNLKINAKEIVETQCYKSLQQIKAIIEDESLTDKECFMQIEEIICVLEKIGSNGGVRHDFG